jgi:hypothetical protein
MVSLLPRRERRMHQSRCFHMKVLSKRIRWNVAEVEISHPGFAVNRQGSRKRQIKSTMPLDPFPLCV